MLIEDFARYGAHDAVAALPQDVLHFAKRAVLDWFSALYPGSRTAPCLQLLRACRGELGCGRSSLPGHDTTTNPATAAWINGSASHAVEFDDIFRDGAYHPGCATIPAALAAAEDKRASGAAFLNAVVVGYEISTRVAAAIQPAHYKYFHTTGTVGCLGSAAAAAALYAPGDPAVMGHALATATTFASGLQQAFRSDAMTKALHAGHAAAVGIRAGAAASCGITGVADILEGEAGFGAAMAGSPDWSGATRGLGRQYNICSITQKNHGCCGHTFAAVDAAIALRNEHRIVPEQIATIRIETYQTAIDVAGNANPATAFEAKFSLPYVVAHALVHGSVRLDAFDADKLSDASLRALMSRVVLHCDPALSAGFPRQRAARVEVSLEDGRRLAHFAPHRKGDPDAPLSDDELDQKFNELVGPVIGAAGAGRLRDLIWRLDECAIHDLTSALSDKIRTRQNG